MDARTMAEKIHNIIKARKTKDIGTIVKDISEMSASLRQATGRQSVVDVIGRTTSLLAATVTYNMPAITKLLVKYCEVELNTPFTYSGKTTYAICIAAETGHDEMVQKLIELGANSDVNDSDQRSPLFWVITRDYSLACELIGTHPDFFTKCVDKYMSTCLHRALMHDTHSLELCKQLVEHGASVNAVDSAGDSILLVAVYASKRAVKFLLDQGCDYTLKNNIGGDALMSAALRCRYSVVEVMVKCLQPSRQRLAEVQAILGSQALSLRYDLASAIVYWKKYVAAAIQAPATPTPDIFANTVEIFDEESVESIDIDAAQVQAQLFRQRILGQSHPETIRWMTSLALQYYITAGSYFEGLDMFSFAASTCTEKSAPTSEDGVLPYVESFEHLTKYRPPYRELDMKPLRSLLQMSSRMARAKPTTDVQRRCVNKLVVVAADTIWQLTGIVPQDDQLQGQLTETVIAFNESPRTALLSAIVGRYASEQRCVSVVSTLASAGLEVDQRDFLDGTALHIAANKLNLATPSTRPHVRAVYDLLLELGADPNVINSHGMTVQRLLDR